MTVATSTSRRHLALRLTLLAAVALLLVGCPAAAPVGPTAPAGGDLHVHISKAFDNRATEADLWNSGTITADGTIPVAKLESGTGVHVHDVDAAHWSATTQQQLGDFTGDCNSAPCNPCTATYDGSSWAIGIVDLTVQEGGNGRYVVDLWMGDSELPSQTGGCDPIVNQPFSWGDSLAILITGVGSATPSATITGWRVGSGSDNSGAGGYTVEVNP